MILLPFPIFAFLLCIKNSKVINNKYEQLLIQLIENTNKLFTPHLKSQTKVKSTTKIPTLKQPKRLIEIFFKEKNNSNKNLEVENKGNESCKNFYLIRSKIKIFNAIAKIYSKEFRRILSYFLSLK